MRMQTLAMAAVLGVPALCQQFIPEGSRVRVRLERALPVPGGTWLVSLAVTEPVIVNNSVLIEAGAPASGHLTGRGKEWTPDRVRCVDGTWAELRGGLVKGGGADAQFVFQTGAAGPIRGASLHLDAVEREQPKRVEWIVRQGAALQGPKRGVAYFVAFVLAVIGMCFLWQAAHERSS
jgi:hypothetical protein